MTQTTLNNTRVAVEATINVAEERHSLYLNASLQAHQQEMESVRRDARAAQEANQFLQDQVLQLQHGAIAEAARVTRLRDLELAYELQGNEMRAMQRESWEPQRKPSSPSTTAVLLATGITSTSSPLLGPILSQAF